MQDYANTNGEPNQKDKWQAQRLFNLMGIDPGCNKINGFIPVIKHG